MWAITLNVIKERLRNKTLYIVAFVGIAVMLLISTSGSLSINGEKIMTFEKMIPVTIAIISFIGNLLAIMISMQTIPNEFERKTTHLVLIRGIKPWQYMFSLSLGNALTSLMSMGLMFLSLIILCGARGQYLFIYKALGAILILSLNTILLSSIISVLSIKLPAFITGLLGILIYFIGVFHNLLSTIFGAISEGAGRLLGIIFRLLPNFANTQSQASNVLLGRTLDIYPIVNQLLFIYIVLSFCFVLFRKAE